MTKILFICHGNICRSTMAQYVMIHLLEEVGLSDNYYVDSAGVSREEIGNGVHPGTVRKLRSLGIPVGNHHARQITTADFKEFDMIIAMDGSNMRNLQRMVPKGCEKKLSLLLSFAGLNRDIADPWYTGNFDATYNDILCGCKSLLEEIRGKQNL
ncbi:MAG: low molecular weight phosphotyrosine protein phosphatase [Spirochaetaceae bacterium]|nr:low molecular weight phosphotyrosine protein phosphatase [Spirochaetaceae bacterium]